MAYCDGCARMEKEIRFLRASRRMLRKALTKAMNNSYQKPDECRCTDKTCGVPECVAAKALHADSAAMKKRTREGGGR